MRSQVHELKHVYDGYKRKILRANIIAHMQLHLSNKTVIVETARLVTVNLCTHDYDLSSMKHQTQFSGRKPGVISRGAQGDGAPLIKLTVHFGGLSPPKNSCIGFAFQSVLTLLLKCFVLL